MTVGTLGAGALHSDGFGRVGGFGRGGTVITTRRLRSIGWIAVLVICAALVMVLAFRVNALRSQVHQSEEKIIALRQDTMYLETEFETRASQQQLKAWNDVEFGYVAPTATQYLDNERQLAAFAKPVEPDAPAPIRVASADDSVVVAAVFPAMVSPMTGKAAGDVDEGADRDRPVSTDIATLSDRLASVPHDAVAKPAKKTAHTDKSGKLAVAAHKPARAGVASKKTVSRHAGVDSRKPHTSKAASAVARKHDGRVAKLAAKDVHRRATPGAPLIKLALKDAKTVK